MADMRIVQVVPGSGDNYYCENCVRDLSVVRALHRAGHDVTAVPLYLPHILDTLDATQQSPIFFGGINSYLQQNYGLFRRTPRWLDSLLDAGPLLRMAARKAGSAQAEDLGEMTLSMQKGAEGNQRKELERLIQWLDRAERPDVVHISNPMLLGIGLEIKRRLGVPLVCSLQDEDVWIDDMEEPYRGHVWELMAEQGREVDAFVAVSRHYGEVMRDRMRIPDERIHVVPIGTDATTAKRSELPNDPPVIGFLAQMSEPLGLRVLVDAFLELRDRPGFANLRLHASGGKAAADDAIIAELREKVATRGAADAFRIVDDFDPDARSEFMASLTVFSVPAPNGIAYGTSVIEALAAGVPSVLPRRGAFPELIEATGGGVLYDPDDPEEPARSLGALLTDRTHLQELGRTGREAVLKKLGLASMAQATLAVYERAVAIAAAKRSPEGSPS